MKTITDFKRRLQVGIKLHTIYHMGIDSRDSKGYPVYKDIDRGIREVSKVMSTQFALTTNGDNSYCNYPKTCEVMKLTEDSITIGELDWRKEYKEYIPVLTYTFIK